MSHLIAALITDLREALLAAKCDIPLVSGIQRTTRSDYEPRIEIGHSYTAPDSPPHFPAGLPKKVTRELGDRVAVIDHTCRARVFGHSPLEGATQDDHEADALDLTDYLIVAMYDITQGACVPQGSGAGKFRWTSARFVSPVEILQQEGTEIEGFPGACYELTFNMPRAVLRRPRRVTKLLDARTNYYASSVTQPPDADPQPVFITDPPPDPDP